MVIIPNSRIRLLKSPIELDNRNQLTFNDVNTQTSYFLSLPYLEYDECTYQRKEGVIRFETEPNGITFEDLLGYNYCMYQNTSYGNKWFYAFITDIKYINDGMTEIKIETDVIETWKFEINYKPSFIEREHTNDDTIGSNTIPEGLETGEYVEAANATKTSLSSDFYICFCVTKNTDGTTQNMGNMLNGVYNGLSYYLVRGKDYGGGSAQYDPKLYIACGLFIYWYAVKNQLQQDNIESVFVVPRSIINESSLVWTSYQVDPGTVRFYASHIEDSENLQTISTLVSKPSTLAGGYVPKNNKLKCYPYRYLLATNNSGTSVVYHYELFSDNDISFQIKGTVTPGCEIKLIPINYKNNSFNYNEGLTFGKFPVCSWIKDVYLNWITSNSVNNMIGVAGGITKTIVGGVEGNPEGAAEGVGNILEVAKAHYEHQFAPNQAMGNTNCGDINFATGYDDISFLHFSIKPEYSAIIDNFFSMYGYKTNLVKTPNITGRSNWNYVKTRGLNITGDIPQEDMQKIKEIFDNGITFWHNPSTFLDYSQSNYIV